MEFLIPAATKTPEAALDALADARFAPFDPRVTAFLADFSARMLADPVLRAFPELVALGYWFRPAAVAALAARHRALSDTALLRPRGVVLHIAPGNVDAVFVYSWLLALLCGNRNIVRLSRRDSAARSALLALLAVVLHAHPEVAAANVLLSYPRDDSVSAALSARCQLRVVWGGNDTVQHFRRVPLPPLSTELVFPDRQAWAAFHAGAVCAADDDALARLASNFHNDAFWFGQQACSSPRAVLWIGESGDIAAAKRRFWPALTAELSRRSVRDEPAELAARIVAAHRMAAADEMRTATPLSSWPLRIEADSFSAAARDAHCGYGLFIEIERPDLAAAASLFRDADQTLAQFGFDTQTLRAWAATLDDRALDRIVPLGQALQFSDRWDGHDLLLAFSRQVVIG
ncbi:acyl-CoA reductase [Niveibacterium umoris]|uniref:long-chain-fatty-acyl-CoA reductase n=1 Tax=Niveibacterium umoris TaxID=1193620 RepID=A0A840BEE8_9RHOO|nr:acyl-CoA reductase [Niveibacterium umoris]MBB4011911.1 hypothetical protein [Niveibacterium umoris]